MPGKDPISSLADLDAIQAQADRFLEIISSIASAIKAVPAIAGDYKAAEGMKQLKDGTDALAKANADLLTQQKYLDAEMVKSKALNEDVARQIAIQRESNKQKVTDLRAEAREAAGLNDAYRKLELQYQAAARAAKNLQTVALRTGLAEDKKAADEASAAAKNLSNQLKAIDDSVGQSYRKVGDYVGAIKILDKSLQEIKNRMDQMTQAGKQNTAEYHQMEQEFVLLNALSSQQAKGFTSLTMEIRAGERALQSMRAAGLENSEAFEQLQLNVANAKREFNEFQKNQQLLESAAPHLQALTTVAKGLGGIYATGAGAAALFADGNEKVEKELNKLVAIMTVLQGLNEVHELLERKGAIATLFHFGAVKSKNTAMVESTGETVANTVATEGAAVAETEAAVATTVWARALGLLKTAFIATGLGALLVFLPEIAKAMMEVSDESEEMKLRTEALHEVNDKMVESFAAEKVNVELSVAQLKDENISRTEKTRIIKELQDKYPDYLGNIKNEGEYTEGLAKAINEKLIPALKQEAIVKAAQDLITEKTKQILETQNNMIDKGATLWDKAKIAVGGYYHNLGMVVSGMESAKANAADQIADLQKQIDALIKIVLQGDEALSALGKGRASNKVKQDFTDYEEGFRQLREEIQKFQNEAFAKDLDPYLKSLADLKERYQETFIKINDVRDNDLKKVKENVEKGVISEAQGAKLRVKIEEDSDQAKLAAEQAYYENLNALQEKERARLAAQRKADDARNFREALQSQQRIQKELQDQASEHFRLQSVLTKNAAQITPSFGNEKAAAAAERDEQLHNLTMLLQAKKITQEEFDSDAAVAQDNYNKRIQTAQEKQLQTWADRSRQVFNQVDALEKQSEARRIAAIEHQIQKTEELKNKDLGRIQASSLSETEKAAAAQMIEKRAADQTAALQRKMRDEKVKEANFDKARGIMDAIVNTYVNATRVSYDPIQEALVIAAGLTAVATIAAQRVPQYASGTEYSKGGLALTDERGPEGYITPSGHTFIGNDRPTYRILEEGTKIIPYERMRQLQQSGVSIGKSQQDRQLERKLDKLNSTMERMEEIGREQISAIKRNKPLPQKPSGDISPELMLHIYKSCS